MPSLNKHKRYLRLTAGGAVVLLIGLLLLLVQSAGPGYAAPPAAPVAKHRTPTVTPTPTPTGRSNDVRTQSLEDELGIDPFIGYESVPAFLVGVPDLCGDTVV
ncbi:MAG: hypothetical protein WBO46_02450, partial [Caldilineaceae bacterium]